MIPGAGDVGAAFLRPKRCARTSMGGIRDASGLPGSIAGLPEVGYVSRLPEPATTGSRATLSRVPYRACPTMTASPPPRLLLLACSRQKREDDTALPALERYDGPHFRLVRRYLRGEPAHPPIIYVLSAEYGLVAATEVVPHYEHRMTASRARQLRPTVTAALTGVLAETGAGDVLAYLGRTYRDAIDLDHLNGRGEVRWPAVEGTMGGQLNTLYTWLYGAPPPKLGHAKAADGGVPVLRGVEVRHDRDSAMEAARNALREGRAATASPQSWYVLVDGTRVSVKWLAARLSGLPVSRFHSQDARRLLDQIGIELHSASTPDNGLAGDTHIEG